MSTDAKWHTIVYFMPDGDVEIRYENEEYYGGLGKSEYASRAFAVAKVLADPPRIEFIKTRYPLEDLITNKAEENE